VAHLGNAPSVKAVRLFVRCHILHRNLISKGVLTNNSSILLADMLNAALQPKHSHTANIHLIMSTCRHSSAVPSINNQKHLHTCLPSML
jgi:hypothetical protein